MYRTLLVPTDGSPRASKALRAAARMARESGARLYVLNVQPTYVATVAPAPEAAAYVDKTRYERDMRRAAERILEGARRDARRHGADCRTLAVFSGSVSQAIVRAARRLRADLIVIASHGRGPVANLLLGSTTQKVLAACRIPLLIHR